MDGHKALFWMPRVECTEITRLGYDKLGESTIAFLCSYCTLVKQHNEIDILETQ